MGGPTVLVGEEITARRWHLIGVGIRDTVSWRQPLEAAIDAVHAQGGVAILAHPVDIYRSALNDAARTTLDGTEVRHALLAVYPEVHAALANDTLILVIDKDVDLGQQIKAVTLVDRRVGGPDSP